MNARPNRNAFLLVAAAWLLAMGPPSAKADDESQSWGAWFDEQTTQASAFAADMADESLAVAGEGLAATRVGIETAGEWTYIGYEKAAESDFVDRASLNPVIAAGDLYFASKEKVLAWSATGGSLALDSADEAAYASADWINFQLQQAGERFEYVPGPKCVECRVPLVGGIGAEGSKRCLYHAAVDQAIRLHGLQSMATKLAGLYVGEPLSEGWRQAETAVFWDQRNGQVLVVRPDLARAAREMNLPSADFLSVRENERIVFVNGIWNNHERAMNSARLLADKTLIPVHLVFNAEEGPKVGRFGASNLLNAALSKLGGMPSLDRAVRTLREEIQDARQDRSLDAVYLVAHSHGSFILADAAADIGPSAKFHVVTFGYPFGLKRFPSVGGGADHFLFDHDPVCVDLPSYVGFGSALEHGPDCPAGESRSMAGDIFAMNGQNRYKHLMEDYLDKAEYDKARRPDAAREPKLKLLW